MTKPRSDPRPSISEANFKCVICSQFSKGRNRQKFQLREKPKAVNLRKAAECLMDEVYTRITELVTPEQILAADLQIHLACFPDYMHKWKAASQKDITHPEDYIVSLVSKRDIFKRHSQIIRTVLDQGKRLSLTEIRDMINNKEESNLLNKVIKCFLLEEFGDNIKFCNPERKNESQFVFSSSIQLDDVVNSLRRMNVVKSAAAKVTQALLNVDFKLENRFCDAQEFKKSWKATKELDVLLTFFSVLLNQSRAKLIRDDCESSNIFDEHSFYELEDEEDERHEFSL